MRITSIIIICFFPIVLLASNNLFVIDSLKNIVEKQKGENRISTLLQLSEASRNINYSDCIKYSDIAFDEAQSSGNTLQMAKIKKSQGVSYYYNGSLNESVECFKKSLKLYTDIDNYQGQADCLNNIGLIYEEWGKLDKSFEYHQKSYNLEKKLKNKKGMATSLMQMGNVCYYSNAYNKSMEFYTGSLAIYTEINNKHGIALSYNAIGIIYKHWKQFDTALEYYQKAIDIYKEDDNDRTMSIIYGNMAEIYNFEFKNYKKARILYEKSLKLKKKVEDMVGIALLKNNIGTLYANMEDYTKALDYFRESENLYKDNGFVTSLAMVYYNIGSTYFTMDKIPEAIEYYQKSLKIAKETNQTEYINGCYQGFIQCYAKICEYDNFEKYFSLYIRGKDTIIDKYYELESEKYDSIFQKIDTSNHTDITNSTNNRWKQNKLKIFAIISFIVLIIFVIIELTRLKRKSAKK